MIVCLCHGISDREIKKLICSGKKLEEITATCGAGSSCGACVKVIKSEIDGYNKGKDMSEDLFDMFANLKGLKVEDAQKLLPISFLVRVSEKDAPITAEYLPERLNLITDSAGIIQDVFWG